MSSNNSTLDLSGADASHTELITTTFLVYTAVALKIVLNPILGVTSICANLINMAVFLKLGFSNGVNQNFFILSISDTLIAITALINSGAYVVQVIVKTYGAPSHFNTDSQIVYWAAYFAFPFAQNISLITTVVIAVVRSCCVAMPLNVKDVLTAKRQLIIILISCAISSAVYVYAFSPLHVQYGTDPITNSSVAFMVGAHFVVYISFNNATFFGSFIVVVVCAVILSVNLSRSSRFRDTSSSRKTTRPMPAVPTSSSSDIKSSAGARDRRIVKTVVMVSVVFIVCNLVTMVYLFLSLILTGFSPLGKLANGNQFTLMVTETFALINATVNIFIYIAFNSRYRLTLNGMFGLKKK